MDTSMVLANLGSMCLGLTLAIVAIASIGGRHADRSGVEGCLITLLCVSGLGMAAAFYLSAINL